MANSCRAVSETHEEYWSYCLLVGLSYIGFDETASLQSSAQGFGECVIEFTFCWFTGSRCLICGLMWLTMGCVISLALVVNMCAIKVVCRHGFLLRNARVNYYCKDRIAGTRRMPWVFLGGEKDPSQWAVHNGGWRAHAWCLWQYLTVFHQHPWPTAWLHCSTGYRISRLLSLRIPSTCFFLSACSKSLEC